MVEDIYIPGELKGYQLEKRGTLQKLNRLNILIGPNNSGKSRFLRGVFKADFTYTLKGLDQQNIASKFDDFLAELFRLVDSYYYADVSTQDHSGILQAGTAIKNLLVEGAFPVLWSSLEALNEYINSLTKFKLTGASNKRNVIGTSRDTTPLENSIKVLAESFQQNLSNPYESLPQFEKMYIPILRGLRPIQISSFGDSSVISFNHKDDPYRKRTIKDYYSDVKEPEKLNIFTGLSLYEETSDLLLGTIGERRRIKEFEDFLSQNFFNAMPVSLTPHRKSDCLYITIGDDDRPIYELGDGIQNIISLLYPLFFNLGKNILCFIEEPEMSLHPGMQRLFVDTVMSERFKSMQFFITTHSNHFLDMILDHSQISIYNFCKSGIGDKASCIVTNTSNDDINLLDSIGVRSSSVFLSNCTLWVEGITDRLYLNKYLEVYQRDVLGNAYETKRLKEDLHYSFVEYGGNNIVHYSFEDSAAWDKIKASKISSKIMLIVDNDGVKDGDTSKKALRINELKAHLGDNLIVLDCREIENTLSESVLVNTISSLEGKSDLDTSKIKFKSYKSVYLGKFIEKSISGLSKKYSSDSGTIYNKVPFCKVAIEQIKSKDDLSETAIEICKLIYGFIEKAQ